jgi:hypothetical protein
VFRQEMVDFRRIIVMTIADYIDLFAHIHIHSIP